MEIAINCNKEEGLIVLDFLKRTNPGLVEDFSKTVEIESDHILLCRSGSNIDAHIDCDTLIKLINHLESFIHIMRSVYAITNLSFRDIINSLDDFTIRVDGHNVAKLDDNSGCPPDDMEKCEVLVFNNI